MGDAITQSLESLATDNEEFKKALKVLLKYEIHCLLQRLSATGEEAIVITTNITEGAQDHLGTLKGVGFLQEAQTVLQLKRQFHSYCTGEEKNWTETVQHDAEIDTSGSLPKQARLDRKRKRGDRDQLFDGGYQAPAEGGKSLQQIESEARDHTDQIEENARERKQSENGDAKDLGFNEDGERKRVKRRSKSSLSSTHGSDQSIVDADLPMEHSENADGGDSCEENIKKGPGHSPRLPSNDSKQCENDNIPMDFTWKVEKIKSFMGQPKTSCKPVEVLKEDCAQSLEMIRSFESGKPSAFHAYLPNDLEMHHSSRMCFDNEKHSVAHSEVYDLRKNHNSTSERHKPFSEETLVDYSSKSKDSSSLNLTEILNTETSEHCATKCKSDSVSSGMVEAQGREWYQSHFNAADAGDVLCQMQFQLRMQRHIENEFLGSSATETVPHEMDDDQGQRVNATEGKEGEGERKYSKYKESTLSHEDQITLQNKTQTVLHTENHSPVNRKTDASENEDGKDQDNSSPIHTRVSVDDDNLGRVAYTNYGLDCGPVNLKTDIKTEPVFDESLVSAEYSSMEYSPGNARSPALGSSPVHLNFTCKLCGQNFKNRQYRDFHVKLHSSSHKFLCNLCSLGFNTEEECASHQSAHTEPVFQCDNCGYRCTREFRMRAHKEICGSPAKIFTCPYCDKQFAAQRYMRIHMKSHDSQNVHSCPYCQNTYPLKNSLLKHVKKKHSS